MPKQGEIRVWMTREAAAAAGEWLSAVYVPYLAKKPANMTGLLGTPDMAAESSRRLTKLSRLLAKTARRRQKQRAEKFTINIPKESARSFVSVVESYRFPPPMLFGMSSPAFSHRSLITGPLPPEVKIAGELVKAATSARRGRPTLLATERKVRLNPDYAYDERNRKRVKQADRNYEETLALFQNSGSLLGLATPRSKI
jgi:hypothetical protein